jgi:tetratricopeptide (TPR) repeat protein
MGLVYLATRADLQYEKRVAIKLLSGAAREKMLSRFRVERQILAKLDHPNICRMFDGGVTDDGEPYIVMEYIPGAVPVDGYCDAHELDIQARIKVFLNICEAVQYAHQFLVVHRDLKPSNVLVSRYGEVKLMDFGIAKDLMAGTGDNRDGDLRLSGARYPGTQAGRSMTPHYASPEQVKGEPIGTSSDIYSLGVMLYELLTGRPPYEYPDSDIAALLDQICVNEPEAPSRRVAQAPLDAKELHARKLRRPRQLQKTLQGDLDAIVLKAMGKDPQNRYASVDRLGEDLRRYLEGQPVVAVTAGIGYRAAKALLRNRALATSGLMIFLAAISLMFAARIILADLTGERDAVQHMEARVRDQARLAGAMASRIFSGPAREASPRERLDRAKKAISEILPGQPELHASMAHALGDAYLKLGDADAAKEMLTIALEQARRIAGPSSGSSAVRASLAHAMLAAGDAAGAERVFRSILDGAAGELAVSAASGLAAAQRAQGQKGQSIETLRHALKERAADPDIDRIEAQLARYWSEDGQHDVAEPLAGRALARREQRYGAESLEAGESLFDLGRIHLRAGHVSSASQYLRQCLEIRRRVLGEEHVLIAEVLSDLGEAAARSGKPAEAVEHWEKAIGMVSRLGAYAAPSSAAPLASLAAFHAGRGECARAWPALEAALKIQPASAEVNAARAQAAQAASLCAGRR